MRDEPRLDHDTLEALQSEITESGSVNGKEVQYAPATEKVLKRPLLISSTARP